MSEVLLQLTSGRGPAECAWVVARLVDAILADAWWAGLEAEMIEKEDGSEKDTFLSALVHLAGEGCDAFAAGYEGTVQWIGKSTFRPGHKRKKVCRRPAHTGSRNQIISRQGRAYRNHAGLRPRRTTCEHNRLRGSGNSHPYRTYGYGPR